MQGQIKNAIHKLQQDILLMQGFKPAHANTVRFPGLENIEAAFSNNCITTGAIHEFLCPNMEQRATSCGFIGGLLGVLMQKGGACLWVSASRTLFPVALKQLGVVPDRIIFIDLKKEKDVLWVTEEGLKCEGLAAVVAELDNFDFKQSRRLQLVTEKSKVTGFILRRDIRKLSANACIARWQIKHLPSESIDGLPGIGFPRWQVELLKVRNGKPGTWQVEWAADKFVIESLHEQAMVIPLQRKTG
jgi:protein ImuA